MVNTPRAAMQAVRQKLAEAGLDSVQFESRILLETVLELPYGAPLPRLTPDRSPAAASGGTDRTPLCP